MTKLSRRQALSAAGTVSLASILAACGSDDPATVATTDGARTTVEPRTTAPTTSAEDERFDASATCTVTPQQAEGPYYFDADAIRRDIREDRAGTELRLALRVRDAASCEPIENAVVDIWHCDASGLYSGFESASQGMGGGGRSDDERYLRGAQVTNESGVANFTTVYPGWYGGRTVHIHAKVHLDRQTVLTTQLYFDDAFTERVFAAEPYAERPGRDTLNDSDGIFSDQTLLTLSERDDGSVLGVMTFDVQQA